MDSFLNGETAKAVKTHILVIGSVTGSGAMRGRGSQARLRGRRFASFRFISVLM